MTTLLIFLSLPSTVLLSQFESLPFLILYFIRILPFLHRYQMQYFPDPVSMIRKVIKPYVCVCKYIYTDIHTYTWLHFKYFITLNIDRISEGFLGDGCLGILKIYFAYIIMTKNIDVFLFYSSLLLSH